MKNITLVLKKEEWVSLVCFGFHFLIIPVTEEFHFFPLFCIIALFVLFPFLLEYYNNSKTQNKYNKCIILRPYNYIYYNI